jgi:hypothetical protein
MGLSCLDPPRVEPLSELQGRPQAVLGARTRCATYGALGVIGDDKELAEQALSNVPGTRAPPW